MPKQPASVSLDLDNKWSYMKTHGDSGWDKFPTYFDVVVPRFLEIFERRRMNITVFVVGEDAAIKETRDSLASIAAAGHEIGNHSFNHEPWLHLYETEKLENEFEQSEAAILQATGKKTIGFRGPGFSISDDVIKVLASRGYEYDATIFPTFLGPAARAYYFFKSSLSKSEKDKRKLLFGRFKDGFRPNKPFVWDLPGSELVELPVTTMPVTKVPLHMSYLLYLARFSRLATRMYFWKAIRMCKLFGVAPSFLLHPLDFMGKEDDGDLSFFPGMDLPVAYKLEVVEQVFDSLQNNFDLLCMQDHANHVRKEKTSKRGIELVRPAMQ